MQNANALKAQIAVITDFLTANGLAASQPAAQTLLAKLQTAAAGAVEPVAAWTVTTGPMSNVQYVHHRGLKCPSCGSANVSAEGQAQAEGARAWQDVTCGECNARWNDTYVLTGYADIAGGLDLEAISSVVEDVKARAEKHGFSVDSEAQARECVDESCDLVEPGLSEAERKQAVLMLMP